mgnify:CR=1 FL=1
MPTLILSLKLPGRFRHVLAFLGIKDAPQDGHPVNPSFADPGKEAPARFQAVYGKFQNREETRRQILLTPKDTHHKGAEACPYGQENFPCPGSSRAQD